MDLINAKSIKIKKIAKKLRVHTISDLFFRAIEIIVVTVVVAKICYELLDSNISVYFLFNRHLAFVLGNVIVIALIAKSSVFKNLEIDSKSVFYEEFVRESSRTDRSSEEEIRERSKQSKEESNEKKQSITENRVKQSTFDDTAKQSTSEKIEKQSIIKNKGKQNICEKTKKQSLPSENRAKQNICKKQSITEDRAKQSITEDRAKQSIVEEKSERSETYQRSKSENYEGRKKKSVGILKRSETSSDRYDNDDELRSKIESFIARQRRNQVEEEFCVSLD